MWRYRRIVLFATVVVLGAAFIYLSKTTPIYTSTSRIYVEQSGPKIITEMEEGVMTQSKNYLYTQAELLRSTPILSGVLEVPEIKQMQTFAKVANPIAHLKGNFDVRVGKKDDIISVSFNSPYPAEAAQVVNAVVDSYMTYHTTRRRSTSVLKILQNEYGERSKELSEQLKAMMDFKTENTALAFEGKQGNIVIEQFERLSVVLTEARLRTIETKSIYESTKEMVGDPIRLKQFVDAQLTMGGHISTSTRRTELESKLEQLQTRRADRLRQVTADHPAVKALDSEIAQIKAQIANLNAEFAQARLVATEQQYSAAKEREDQIAKYYEDQRQRVLDLTKQLAQYTILQSEWEQTKKLCDILDGRINALNVTADVGALNIRILEVAQPAEKPSEPKEARYMAIALAAGLLLGGGLALLRDWMDQRFHSSQEISVVLGVPVLGVVPSMSRWRGVVGRGQKVHKDSDSSAAEAYRTIRTALFFGAPKGEAKTVLVTSPAAGEGKSTLVSNLAIAMAKAGQKTLIMDANFRNQMQQKTFQVDHQDVGLSTVLGGTTTLEEATHHTEVEGLKLLPCGPDVPDPSEMLDSEVFAKLLEYASNRYDRVIIDSPPVMPVTDAQILAAICNTTLLVLRAEKSTRTVSQQACDGLLSVGAHVLGAVVNDVPRKDRSNYYRGWGFYCGYYGHGGGKKETTAHKKPAVISEGPDRFSVSND